MVDVKQVVCEGAELVCSAASRSTKKNVCIIENCGRKITECVQKQAGESLGECHRQNKITMLEIRAALQNCQIL